MKSCNNLFNLIKRMTLVVLLGMVVFGCAPKEPAQQEVVRQEPEATIEEIPSVDTACVAEDMDTVVDKGAPMMSKGKKGDQKGLKLKDDDFEANIDASKRIKLGDKGKLKVRISMKKHELEVDEDMKRKTIPLISAYTGAYARITPSADDFIISPDNPKLIAYDNVAIVRVDSTGVEVQYTIIPQKSGKLNAGASIDLFDNRECTGDPLTINPNALIKVRVNYWKAIWDPVWEGFTYFWCAFVALVFGALLFVVRKFIKEKTGYSDDLKDKIFGGRKTDVTEGQKATPKAPQKALEERNDEVTGTESEMPDEKES